jgi:hypothetical protein
MARTYETLANLAEHCTEKMFTDIQGTMSGSYTMASERKGLNNRAEGPGEHCERCEHVLHVAERKRFRERKKYDGQSHMGSCNPVWIGSHADYDKIDVKMVNYGEQAD